METHFRSGRPLAERARRLPQEGRIRPAETSDGSRRRNRPSASPRDAHVQRQERFDDPDQGLAQIGAHAAGHRFLERAIITGRRPFCRLTRRCDRLDQPRCHPTFDRRVPVIRVREQRRHRRRHDGRQQRHHEAALVRLPKAHLPQQIRRLPVRPGSVDRLRLAKRTRRRQQEIAGAADEVHAVVQGHAAVVALRCADADDVAGPRSPGSHTRSARLDQRPLRTYRSASRRPSRSRPGAPCAER